MPSKSNAISRGLDLKHSELVMSKTAMKLIANILRIMSNDDLVSIMDIHYSIAYFRCRTS